MKQQHRFGVLAGALLSMTGSGVTAQVIRPATLVASGTADIRNAEVSLASSPVLPGQVVVAWQRIGDPEGRVHCGQLGPRGHVHQPGAFLSGAATLFLLHVQRE